MGKGFSRVLFYFLEPNNADKRRTNQAQNPAFLAFFDTGALFSVSTIDTPLTLTLPVELSLLTLELARVPSPGALTVVSAGGHGPGCS